MSALQMVSHLTLACSFVFIFFFVLRSLSFTFRQLWGKLQILGLGTALKILFSVENLDQLVLTRNEVIALLNFAARLSEAIRTVGTLLCTLIAEGFQDVIVPSHCRRGRRRAA